MRLPNVKDKVASLYHGKMAIIEYRKTKDENGISKLRLERVQGGIACRLSYKRKTQNQPDEDASELQIETVIYCDPDIIVPAGAVIEVTQEGATEKYELAGGVVKYHNHQEIYVRKFEVRA